MSKARPPWWIYAVLVPCTCYHLALLWCVAWGPESPGLAAQPNASGSRVMTIQAGLPADRAGVKVGDVILSVNGVNGPRAVWQLHRAVVGEKFDLLLERHGERRSATWILGRKNWAFWTSSEGFVLLATVPSAILMLGLAWLIAFRRAADPAARFGALLFALGWIAETFELRAPPGFGTFLSRLPFPLAALPLAAVVLAHAISGPVALMFFGNFPHRRKVARWVQAVVWGPALVGGVAAVALVGLVVYQAEWPLPEATAAWWRGPKRLLDLGYLCAAPLVLWWNYRTLSSMADRRRVRLFVAAIVTSIAPSVFEVALLLLSRFGYVGARSLLLAYWSSPAYVLSGACALAGAMLAAYSILRHRVFDLGIIIRQGLQYAAAKNMLLGLAPTFAGVLVLDLALHSNQSMAEAFLQRGWLYAVLGGAALVAHAKRRTWLEALDRRFFRERYDAHRILRTVLTEVRSANTLEQAAPRVVAQVDAALHPAFAAILAREPRDSSFHAVSASGPAPETIPADGKLMALVRLLGKPVDVAQTDTSWVRQQLPPEETRWVAESKIEWIFPIVLGADRRESVLVLAQKRSEQPYSQEDRELVEGAVSGLGLLAEHVLSTPSSPSSSLSALPGEAEDLGVGRLSTRYAIRREIGRGGMGSVYEAQDTELERAVAVKVIKPALLASPEAVARFRREARLAASFSHPNVVTVHDFGVAEDGRAFLVMELLSGITLRAALRQQGRLPGWRALAILRGVCAAVGTAHERHLLHRDLKPENVFLSQTGGVETPKVLDFGVAKLIDTGDDAATVAADTSPGVLLGTIAYMSPEQLRGQPPDSGWDVWALAVIAYEMLAGTNPFTGSRPLAAEPAVGHAIAARTFAPESALHAFFERALSPDPRDRPSSARDLFGAFEIALRASPVLAGA